jgi:hypothetical protein
MEHNNFNRHAFVSDNCLCCLAGVRLRSKRRSSARQDDAG